MLDPLTVSGRRAAPVPSDAGRRAGTAAFADLQSLAADNARLARIAIVGGGAGGAILAARLGRRLHGAAEVVLVDRRLTHFWKPLLHEVAAGTLPARRNELSFLQQARRHGYRFHLGAMDALDRDRRQVWLAALLDDDSRPIAPRRPVRYDLLVLALGSITSDFGTPGVTEHATRLDTEEDAERFHRRLLAACGRAEVHARPVHVVIVGGGATGVELAAELHEAVGEIARFGEALSRIPAPVRITLVEASARLLAALPPDVAARVQRDLARRGIDVKLGAQVTLARPDGVVLAGGQWVPADLCVWAAGIKAPPVLAGLGLPVNRAGQLLASDRLVTSDPAVCALGDCAAILDQSVPPTAQAAQQQAEYLADALVRRITGAPAPGPFRFRPRGALISLGRASAAGTVQVSRRSQRLYGWSARVAYWAAQREHLTQLLGPVAAALTLLGNWTRSRSEPRVKLH